MGIPNKQIGWGTKENLLWQIAKQLEKVTYQVAGISGGGGSGTVTSVALASPTVGITISGTPVTSSGTLTFQIATASALTPGLLSSADWTTFNNKQNVLTIGNLSESTSSVLTITGGTGAIIGSGTTIQVKQASGSQSGFLSNTDWTTFNSKQGALTLTTTGTSGAATLIGNTLNIPQYSGGGGGGISGSGAAGQVTYWTGASSVGGNNGLFYDAANGNLGLGTITPTNYSGYKNLAINGAANGGVIDFLAGGTLYGQLYSSPGSTNLLSITNSPLRFGTSGSVRMNIEGNGNVLVNTLTDEGYKFDVDGAIRTKSVLYVTNPLQTGSIQVFMGGNNTGVFRSGPNNENMTIGPGNDIHLNAPGLTINGTTSNYSGNYTINAGGVNGMTLFAQSLFMQGDTRIGYNFTAGFTNALGGNSTLSLIKLTASSGSSGANIDGRMIDIQPTINMSTGTLTLRGIYYNPTLTATTGLTNVAFESTSGIVKISDLSGSGTRMVVADNTGVLSTQAIPSGGSNIYTSDGSLTSNRTVTYNGYSLTFSGSGSSIFTSSVGYYCARFGSALWGDQWLYLGNDTNCAALQGNNAAFTSPQPIVLNVNGGNVGIGITTPEERLHVKGSAILKENAPSGLKLRINNTQSGSKEYSIFVGGTSNAIGAGAFAIADETNGLHRLVITNAGNILIGNNSTVDTGYTLDINGTARIQSTLKVGAATSQASSAVLDVESTTKGFLPPRMTTVERDAITTPAAGLVIFNTTTTKLECYDGTTWQAAW